MNKRVKTHSEQQVKNICQICLDANDVDKEICNFDCGHSFHSKCIFVWFTTKKTCPCCRKENIKCQHGNLIDHNIGTLATVMSSQEEEVFNLRLETESLRNEITALKMQIDENNNTEFNVPTFFMGVNDLDENYTEMQNISEFHRANQTAQFNVLRGMNVDVSSLEFPFLNFLRE